MKLMKFKNIEKKIKIISIEKTLNEKNKIYFYIICFNEENSNENSLIHPYKCSGSMQFIHLNCLKKWLKTKKLIKKIDFI